MPLAREPGIARQLCPVTLPGVLGQRQHGRQQDRLEGPGPGGIQPALPDQLFQQRAAAGIHAVIRATAAAVRFQHAVGAQRAREFPLRLDGVDLERQRGRLGQGAGDARLERIELGQADVQRAEQIHRVAIQADPEQGPALGRHGGGDGQPEQAEQQGEK
jgi:hypothetical protein